MGACMGEDVGVVCVGIVVCMCRVGVGVCMCQRELVVLKFVAARW